MTGSILDVSAINLFGERIGEISIKSTTKSTQGRSNRKGKPSLLEQQLAGEDPGFARVYGFSFDGVYHHLPIPVLYLVHGKGEPVTKDSGSPAISDVEFSSEVRFWTYDRNDITVRMDIETGTMDQVVLDTFLSGPDDDMVNDLSASGGYVRGGYARGGYTRGGYTRGGYARGGYVRGGYVRGGYIRGPEDD